jgi:hypothetical protein
VPGGHTNLSGPKAGLERIKFSSKVYGRLCSNVAENRLIFILDWICLSSRATDLGRIKHGLAIINLALEWMNVTQVLIGIPACCKHGRPAYRSHHQHV